MTLRLLAALAALVLIPVGAVRAQRAGNPHGQGIGPCATCHAPDSWRPVRISKEFRHAERSFPLEGAHARTSCMACHKNLMFDKIPKTCASCHSDVHKGELGTDCARCHTPRSFLDQRQMQRMHELTNFPLRGAHAAARCDACHSPATSGRAQYTGRSTACVDCHATDYRQAKSPDHVVAQFPQDCASCHGSSSWHTERFDHDVTRFPLTGAHRSVACTSCHADKIYQGKPMACASCHQAKFAATTSPPHAAAGFPTSCESCHTTNAWTPGTFDHANTRFPLLGAHLAAVCSSCHADGVYHGKPTICFSCHQKDYNAVTLPPHLSLGYSTVCTDCHTSMATWKGGVFDHQTFPFPLTGAHLAVSCLGCHADNVFKGKSTACASCHQTQYAATTSPPHAAAGFPATCETCHTTASWLTATFNHATTQFPLTGAHLTAACSSCHSDGVYRGKTMVCSGCHQAQFAATTSPPHAAAGFPTSCESCHTTNAWTPGTFNHANTRFPLLGAHLAAVCSSCHADGVYHGKPTICFSCHQKDYNAVTLPPHLSLGYSTVCTDCHASMATWKGGVFDHQTFPFPLTGAHLAVSCLGCHADNVFKGKSTACASCHQTQYAATTSPPHAAAGFPTSCESCHTTNAWTPGTFDHANTRFPLLGAHLAAVCSSCHADGVYHGKPTICFSCHQKDYNAVTLPPHLSLGYSTVCTDCHASMATWKGGVFDHQTFPFPLTGAHLAVSCLGCHADNVFKGKSTACASCHQTQYAATTNPPHAAAGFPATCETCHTTASWLTATFNHATTRFPLTGAHLTVACSSCHSDGVYRGKTMVCSGCHLATYGATTSPSHSAAGFPTNCESCHTTATWLGATFNHDGSFFPIYSGKHKGRWNVCADCHTTPTNYAVFSCFQCHSKSQMDSHHRGRAGYAYDSPTCYACHPRGSGG